MPPSAFACDSDVFGSSAPSPIPVPAASASSVLLLSSRMPSARSRLETRMMHSWYTSPISRPLLRNSRGSSARSPCITKNSNGQWLYFSSLEALKTKSSPRRYSRPAVSMSRSRALFSSSPARLSSFSCSGRCFSYQRRMPSARYFSSSSADSVAASGAGVGIASASSSSDDASS